MLQVQPAMEIVDRFSEGVHRNGECGTNTNGYAAASAASEYADLHNLDNYICYASSPIKSHSRKKSVSSQETMIYIISKLRNFAKPFSIYLILLSRESPTFGAMELILKNISAEGNLVFCVEPCRRHFELSVFYHCNISSYRANDIRDLHVTIGSIARSRNLVVMVYPIVLREWITIINEFKPMLWCVPASRSKLYISTSERSFHSHCIFPWARPGIPSGFTLGAGDIKEGWEREKQRFEGKSNFYDSMISSVPLGSSCTDCTAMMKIADSISPILCRNKLQKKRNFSEGSILALQFIEDRIKEEVEKLQPI